jgi:hypothetical protein
MTVLPRPPHPPPPTRQSIRPKTSVIEPPLPSLPWPYLWPQSNRCERGATGRWRLRSAEAGEWKYGADGAWEKKSPPQRRGDVEKRSGSMVKQNDSKADLFWAVGECKKHCVPQGHRIQLSHSPLRLRVSAVCLSAFTPDSPSSIPRLDSQWHARRGRELSR